MNTDTEKIFRRICLAADGSPPPRFRPIHRKLTGNGPESEKLEIVTVMLFDLYRRFKYLYHATQEEPKARKQAGDIPDHDPIAAMILKDYKELAACTQDMGQCAGLLAEMLDDELAPDKIQEEHEELLEFYGGAGNGADDSPIEPIPFG